MIARRYLAVLALAGALWAGLAAGFIWIIDPYGVAPLRVEIDGLNRLKPKRLDIDRLIKPYEVWRYQPRSIFLGTSRIHQAIDPADLDGTPYAPAYNASIPANTLSENAATIEQYFRLDHRLKYVFAELFLYNFVFLSPPQPARAPWMAFANVVPLEFSSAALFDALNTAQFNRSGRTLGAYVASGGYWVRPPNFDTAATFDPRPFIRNVVDAYRQFPTLRLQPEAFAALDDILAACARHDARLIMLVTPSYPWDDYRLLSLGYWPLLEEWLHRVAEYPAVLSFAQFNSLTEEPPGRGMHYWNDPIHFGRPFGQLMLRATAGARDPEMPDNFMLPLNRQSVETLIRRRREGVERWAAAHQDFVRLFEMAKRDGGAGDHPGDGLALGSQ